MTTTFDTLKVQLVAAFDSRDWEKAETVVRLARQKAQWEQQVAVVTGKTASAKNEGGGKLREFDLPVSFGSEKHSYLSVKRAVDDGLLKSEEEMKIHIPLIDKTVKCHVYRKNKIIYANPQFKEFYASGGIKAGFFVSLKETAPGEWTLTKRDDSSRRAA